MSEDGCRASVSKSKATAPICTLGTSGILKMPVKQHSAAPAAEKEIAEPPKNAQTSLWHLTPAAPLATLTHPQRMSHVCTQSTAVLRRTGRASYPTTRTTNKLGPKDACGSRCRREGPCVSRQRCTMSTCVGGTTTCWRVEGQAAEYEHKTFDDYGASQWEQRCSLPPWPHMKAEQNRCKSPRTGVFRAGQLVSAHIAGACWVEWRARRD